MRRKNFFWLVLSLLILPLRSEAANTSRYPDGNVAYSVDIIGIVKSNYDNLFPLKLQIGLDTTFSENQKRLLFKSLKIFLERSLKKSVVDCAFRNATKDLPLSRQDFEKQLFSSLSILQIDDIQLPSFAFIGKYWDDPLSVGLGYIGLFYEEDHPLPGYATRHYLHIAINADHLGERSSYTYKNNEDYWAGVIGHEFLHNLGYRHPYGYKNSFISEYGHCIQYNGGDAPSLEKELYDTEVEKDL